MPLRNDYDPNTLTLYSPEIKLSQYFKHKGCGAIHGIDEEDAMHISNILATYRLQDFIEIDLKKLAESHESWIYVIIHNDNHDLLSNFGESLTGILTWGNSD